jgi:hypothetical protein
MLAATPEVTAQPNMSALLEKVNSVTGLALPSSLGGGIVSLWPTP